MSKPTFRVVDRPVRHTLKRRDPSAQRRGPLPKPLTAAVMQTADTGKAVELVGVGARWRTLYCRMWQCSKRAGLRFHAKKQENGGWLFWTEPPQ